jgi:membrane fusion protein (multidrug efflux system)
VTGVQTCALPISGSVALRAQLPNTLGSLIPGQFVRVRLQGIERPDAIVVPQRAVQQGPQGKFVFVVGGDGKAAIKPVEAGDWIGQDWIIESGLAAGDKVIVDGAIKVQPGAPVQVVDPSQAQPSGGPAGAPGAGGAEGAPPAEGAPTQDAGSTKDAAPAGPGS